MTGAWVHGLVEEALKLSVWWVEVQGPGFRSRSLGTPGHSDVPSLSQGRKLTFKMTVRKM